MLFIRLRWLLLILVLPSSGFSYPELLSKNCTACHSESSGSGILTAEGKHSENFFEIKAPKWLLLGVKADLKQTFTETPYEKTGSFKATRAEAQLGLSHAVDTYLNISAQGSINRIDPKNKSDSISDYAYSPYRFAELKYSDSAEQSLSAKHGFYRNEWQNDLVLFESSFKQTELIYTHTKHQVSLGYISKIKTYNTSSSMDDGFINYKFLQLSRYSLLIGHQWHADYQLTSLALIAKKTEQLTFKALLAQSVLSGIKGIKARLMPVYQHNSNLKFFGFAEYQNVNIERAKPRSIVYGVGSDYLWFTQGLVSVIYTNTDDSNVINNPMQKLELNLHLYM